MAWTAPNTWVVGQIVTASLLNTYMRDNLKYLKGQAGTVAIEDAMTVAGSMAATGAVSGTSGTFSSTGGTLLSAVGSASTTTINITSPNVASQNAVLQFTNSAQRVGQIIMDRANDKFRITTNTGTTPAISIDSGGNVGVGATITPQGTLHGYESISGFMFYEFDGVDGTARTLISNAAGDVVYGLVGHSVTRHSGGTTKAGTFSGGGGGAIVPGGTQNIYDDGVNIMQIQVNANGAVTVQRTAGTGTFKVRLMILWI